jgi:hypothetical protein
MKVDIHRTVHKGSRMVDQVLLVCGAIAGPLFTVVYLLAGALRRDYRPVRHPVSSLALGPVGWAQTGSFLLSGALTLAFAVGLWRAGTPPAGAVLVGLWGVGLLGAGAFRTDPVRGYPPGTPDLLPRYTRLGALHDGFSLGGFLALALACVVLGLGGPPGWAVYSVASGVLFAAAMVVAGAAFGSSPRLADVGGLVQRVAITIGWLWQTLLALRTLAGLG